MAVRAGELGLGPGVRYPDQDISFSSRAVWRRLLTERALGGGAASVD